LSFFIGTWLILPDVDSEKVKSALEWFYDTSPRFNSTQSDKSQMCLDEIFGNGKSQISSTDSVENKLDLAEAHNFKESDNEKCYEIFFMKDTFTG